MSSEQILKQHHLSQSNPPMKTHKAWAPIMSKYHHLTHPINRERAPNLFTNGSRCYCKILENCFQTSPSFQNRSQFLLRRKDSSPLLDLDTTPEYSLALGYPDTIAKSLVDVSSCGRWLPQGLYERSYVFTLGFL